MKISVFDIGIKNLSFCIIEYDIKCDCDDNKIYPHKIIKWENINLNIEKKNNKYDILDINLAIIKELSNRPYLLEVDIIGLENQPCLKNPVMKNIQIMIYSYFVQNGIYNIDDNNRKIKELVFVNASQKNKCSPICLNEFNKEIEHLKSEYTKRKKRSVYQCRKMCELYNTNFIDFFDNNKKKDDLSDSYLLTYSLLVKNI